MFQESSGLLHYQLWWWNKYPAVSPQQRPVLHTAAGRGNRVVTPPADQLTLLFWGLHLKRPYLVNQTTHPVSENQINQDRLQTPLYPYSFPLLPLLMSKETLFCDLLHFMDLYPPHMVWLLKKSALFQCTAGGLSAFEKVSIDTDTLSLYPFCSSLDPKSPAQPNTSACNTEFALHSVICTQSLESLWNTINCTVSLSSHAVFCAAVWNPWLAAGPWVIGISCSSSWMKECCPICTADNKVLGSASQ